MGANRLNHGDTEDTEGFLRVLGASVVKSVVPETYEPPLHGAVPYNGTTLTVTEDPFTVTVV
jgi:hypothetical protein